MPIGTGYGRGTIRGNVSELIRSGKRPAEAAAIAYRSARESAAGRAKSEPAAARALARLRRAANRKRPR